MDTQSSHVSADVLYTTGTCYGDVILHEDLKGQLPS